MKPIKCWVAQDKEEYQSTYCFPVKPKKHIDDTYDVESGDYRLKVNEIIPKPVKCVIITEEEYNKLKGLKNDTN